MLSSAQGIGMLYQDTPASAVCNDCGKAVAVKAQEFESGGTKVQDVANQKCGSSFASNSLPSSVQEGATQEGEGSSAVDSNTLSNGLQTTLSASMGAIAVGAALFLTSDAF